MIISHLTAMLLAGAAPTGQQPSPPPAAQPATATIRLADAERFARLFARTRGRPDAIAIQRAYLDPGSYGVKVFTPDRIVSAARLAGAIAQHPERYARAIRKCLPVVRDAQADLRAIYRSFHSLLPDRPLPQIYVVFGAGNSGGTAGPGAQVLGLEVLCETSHGDPEALRTTLRRFFAHETVHTWQADVSNANPLAANVLIEGAADFIAALVTGQQPEPARAAWAAPRATGLWGELRADLAMTDGFDPDTAAPGDPRAAAIKRWVWNYGDTQQGRPYELGYWMGQQVWRRYYDAAPDKAAALAKMLGRYDLTAILATYAPG